MVRAKAVNQDFFAGESAVMYYALGIAYATYKPASNGGLTFTSTYKGLLDILKDLLGSEHDIIQYKGKESYKVEILNRKLKEDLEDRISGYDETRPTEGFRDTYRVPIMAKRYHRSFIRGYFDAKATIVNSSTGTTIVRVRGNKRLLTQINKILREEAGVKHSAPVGNSIAYGHAEAMKIYNYLYEKGELDSSLCYTEKRDMYNMEYVHPKTKRRRERLMPIIDKAKRLLRADYNTKQTAKLVGLKYPNQLCNIFAEFVKISPREYQKSVKGK